MKHHTTRAAALLAAFTLCAASAWAAMPDKEFVELCTQKGAAARIEQALKDGANPNAADRSGGAALLLAAQLADASAVRAPDARSRQSIPTEIWAQRRHAETDVR